MLIYAREAVALCSLGLRSVGTRNRLAHGYDEVNLDILWKIVETDFPPLIQQLEEIVGDEP